MKNIDFDTLKSHLKKIEEKVLSKNLELDRLSDEIFLLQEKLVEQHSLVSILERENQSIKSRSYEIKKRVLTVYDSLHKVKGTLVERLDRIPTGKVPVIE